MRKVSSMTRETDKRRLTCFTTLSQFFEGKPARIVVVVDLLYKDFPIPPPPQTRIPGLD